MKRLALALAGLLACAICAAAGLDDYRDQMLPASPKAEAGKGQVTLTFTGVATLLFDDGETSFMTDGFFTRIPQNALRSIRPDRDAITASLKRLGVSSLAAVIPVHSHFDHALDSPVVAMQTGALKSQKADVVYLGIGGLGTKSEDYQQSYWQEIVRTVGAKRVIPIHWDNFFIPLGSGPLPNSDFYGLMTWLQQRGKADGVDVRLVPAWAPADPFAGL